MDKVLRDKFKDTIIVTIVLAGGWYAFPSIWDKISINSDVLGGWRFLLYAFLLLVGFCWLLATVITVFLVLSWIFRETLHLLNTLWKCIVHFELRPYTTLTTQHARETREKERRRQKRKEFLSMPMSIEQKNEYQRGYAETYDEGFKKGQKEGKERGFTDGYSGRNGLGIFLSEIEEREEI